MTNPRRIALEALLDITDAGAYANLRLKDALAGLPQREAHWVSAVVYTTLDHLLYIDHVLAAFAKGRVQPVIRGVLRMGVAQLLYMDVPDNAACNESVNLCKQVGKQKLAGYVNGVLRAICRNRDNLPPLPDDPADRLSIQFSYRRSTGSQGPWNDLAGPVSLYNGRTSRKLTGSGHSLSSRQART